MSDVKLIVAYPQPKDVDAFEKNYLDEHVLMAIEKLAGKTRIIATKTLAHAAEISTGGAPVIMIAEKDTFTF